jgi:CubicO group peptidase (beta-lactamase class C family)
MRQAFAASKIHRYPTALSRSSAMRILVLATLLCVFALPASVRAADPVLPHVDPASVGLDAATLDKISTAMQAQIDSKEISGAVVLILKDGKIPYHIAVGSGNLESGKPLQKDAIFAIASMTKPVTGAAIMMCVDEGKLSLDDPVSKYIPEFKNAKLKGGAAPKREITIRDLVTHTSGLSGEQQNMGTLQETAKKLAARPLEFEPGEKWMYSPGMSVAGACVEVATKMPFDEFLQQRIFTPLGMRDTTFNPNEKQQARIVKLYKKEGGKLVETSHWINDFSKHREPNPSGGLFSTAEDMAAFYAMVLHGGELNGQRILSQTATKELTTIHSGNTTTGFTPGNGWGIGWCVVREPQGVTAMLSKGSAGHGGAFGTQGWIDPERKMAFVLMIQRSGLPNADGSQMREEMQKYAVEAVKK